MKMGEHKPEHQGRILALMKQFRAGDPTAAGCLVEELYPELRHLATIKMAREPRGHSWQPTLLVHDLYLQLVHLKGFPAAADTDPTNAAKEKATFLKLAGLMMHRRLIDHAKPMYRRMPRLELPVDEFASAEPDLDALLYVERLLDGLAAIDPKFRTVVEGRVFLGLTLAEIAAELQCSERTAAAHWSFARQWLADELDRGYTPAA